MPLRPETLIPDLLQQHPQLRGVFDRYGLQGCGGRNGPHESIRFFARAHTVDEELLLKELEAALEEPLVQIGDRAEPALEDVLYRRFFKAGIVFVLTAGASWGAWLLWKIGFGGSFTSVSIHEVNAHGHAQIFGWVGLFVMGFAYQAFPRFKHTRLWNPALANASFYLMVTGIALRVISEPLHTIPFFFWAGLLAAAMEIVAAGLFVLVIARTYGQSSQPVQAHDLYVFAALFWFLAQALGDLGLLWLTTTAANPQQLIRRVATFQAPLRTFQVHGFALLMILGVSQRFLSGMYGFSQAGGQRSRRYWLPLNLAVLGEACFLVLLQQRHEPVWGILLYASILLLAGSVLGLTLPWRLWSPCSESDRSLKFIRAAYAWLYLSLAMLVVMPFYLRATSQAFSHAYYGAARHAITVGFVSMMILGVGSRIVPTLLGRDITQLSRLVLPFVLLNVGCLLRVSLQVATDFTAAAFPVAGVSGLLEVSAIGIWGTHLWKLMRRDATAEEQVTELSGPIHAGMRVGWLVEQAPSTLPVFYEFGFDLLKQPYLRRTVARVTTIRQACRRLGVNEEELLTRLNQALFATGSRSTTSVTL